MMWYGRLTYRLNSDFETRRALLMTQLLRSTTAADGRPPWICGKTSTTPPSSSSAKRMICPFTNTAPFRIRSSGKSRSAQPLQMACSSPNSWRPPSAAAAPGELHVGLIWEDRNRSPRASASWASASPWMPMFSARSSGAKWAPDNPRGLPKGLDFFAAMGSDEALNLLDSMGETSIPITAPRWTRCRARSPLEQRLDPEPVLVLAVFLPAA